MAGDGAVGGVRQAPLLQRRGDPLRRGVGAALGEEAVDHDAVDLAAADGGGAGAGEKSGAASGDGDLVALARRALAGESLLLQLAAAGDQEVPGGAVEPPLVAGQPGLERVRQGEVDVVAAEQDVLADRDPADAARVRASVLALDGEQAEVGGAAADVDDQNVADRAFAGSRAKDRVERLPGAALAAVLFQPGVEGRLRLFQQPNRRPDSRPPPPPSASAAGRPRRTTPAR